VIRGSGAEKIREFSQMVFFCEKILSSGAHELS